MPIEDVRLYTLQDVADILHAPIGTVRYWRSMRRFKVVKVGRLPLVEHGELLALIERCKEQVEQQN